MLFPLNNFTADDLEVVRLVLNWLTIIATAGVWLGVFFEGQRFSPAVQHRAWGLLVMCLGGETLFGVALLQADAQISRFQKAENAILLQNVEVLRAKNLEQAEKVIKLQTILNQQSDKLGDVTATIQNVATKVADREVSEESRWLIKRRLNGVQRHLTIVLLGDREPRAYGIKIAGALQGAGFDVSVENWNGAKPPDTGVVFCEIRNGDREVYEVLHRVRVATQFISLKDTRPDFCDIPGLEFPIEKLIEGVTLGVVTPTTAGGRIIPRGSLAGQRGPRIFVGQRG